ncbi:Rid family detoxifying hydrolase [Bacteroidota bacterium]
MKKNIFIIVLLVLPIFSFAQTKNAPAPIAPYSQYRMANGTLYLSGQIGINPATKKIVSGGLEKEAHQVMKNIGAILKANNMDFSDLVKCTVYLTDIRDYAKMNKVYGSYFKDNKFPARVALEVSNLPMQAMIEISSIAVKQK